MGQGILLRCLTVQYDAICLLAIKDEIESFAAMEGLLDTVSDSAEGLLPSACMVMDVREHSEVEYPLSERFAMPQIS